MKINKTRGSGLPLFRGVGSQPSFGVPQKFQMKAAWVGCENSQVSEESLCQHGALGSHSWMQKLQGVEAVVISEDQCFCLQMSATEAWWMHSFFYSCLSSLMEKLVTHLLSLMKFCLTAKSTGMRRVWFLLCWLDPMAATYDFFHMILVVPMSLKAQSDS